MSASDNAALWHKYELLKGAEHHKNHLIEDLLRRVDQLTDDFNQEKLDRAREIQFNRDVQLREMQLKDDLRRYKAMADRDPYVLLLIDGDGMIFEDKLIDQGEVGGREAAGHLWNAITDHIHQNIPDLGSDYRIVTRIYANLKGLGEVCNKAGILSRPSLMDEFARGFTGSKQLFDFVDVGMGKDRADDKISELFKLHLYDSHCRHVFFGCSHDNGYARLLENVSEADLIKAITLLEGVPFERELAQLKSKYQTTRIDGLFRDTKINVYQQNYYPTNGHLKSPLPAAPGLPPPIQYQSPYQPTITRTPSASTTSSAPLNPAAPTWASTAMAAPLQTASPPQTPTPSAKATQQVPRNRHGQRIDPVIQYDLNEVKRLKKMKMCNVHFLRGDCPYDPCTHDHAYKPNKNELSTLRYVSRMTPCKFGTDCDDVKCIYGHRCPNDTEGKPYCRFGDSCRFDQDAHGLDRNVVKTFKVGGK